MYCFLNNILFLVLWPQNPLEPRLRRIVMIEEPIRESRRSLKSEVTISSQTMASDIYKRKVIAIGEDNYSLHPKFCNYILRSLYKVYLWLPAVL